MLDLKPLAPKEAIAYFRSKGLQESFAWQDVEAQEHARSFAVAKMMSVDLLETTRAEIDKALAEGLPFAAFRDSLKPRLQAAGWWGKQMLQDPLTGEDKLVQLGSDRRLRTIFEANMRVSYQVGQWQRAWAARELLPFMMYRHNTVRFPRLEHKAWDGTVLPITDPWWDTHYPPCAWGCQCSTLSFSQRMLDARGLKVSKPVAFPPKLYTNPRTGEVTKIEQGIDPGWNHNVGKHPWRSLTARPAPPQPGAPKVAVATQNAAIDGFLGAVGALAKPRVVKGPDNYPVTLSRDLFTDANGSVAVPRPDKLADLPLVAQALVKPDRVDWLWLVDAVRLGPARLIRRYTRRLDKRSVTVDFVAGTWTFDVLDDQEP